MSEGDAIRITAASDLNSIINVYSMDGGNVYSESVSLNNTTVNLPKGIYLVKITLANETITEKVIVW